jgi:predicted dinucleotide-binding enzyme
MNSIRIIGYGEFGKFLAGLVPTNIHVLVKAPPNSARKSLPENATIVGYEEMGQADAVILAVRWSLTLLFSTSYSHI